MVAQQPPIAIGISQRRGCPCAAGPVQITRSGPRPPDLRYPSFSPVRHCLRPAAPYGERRRRPCKWMTGVMRIQGVVNDEADFAGFYARSRDACLRAVQVSVADRQVAEDLVAEAF